MIPRNKMAAIHIAKKKANLNDTDYRAVLQRVAGLISYQLSVNSHAFCVINYQLATLCVVIRIKNRRQIMQFGIEKGSSKEITLDHISKLAKEKRVRKNPQLSNMELFIETCYDLAKENDMTAVIHLDYAFITNGKLELKSDELLAVKFTKNKY